MPFLAGPGETEGWRDAIAVPQSRGRYVAGGDYVEIVREATAIQMVRQLHLVSRLVNAFRSWLDEEGDVARRRRVSRGTSPRPWSCRGSDDWREATMPARLAALPYSSCRACDMHGDGLMD